MVGILKIYLFGILVSATGVADQNQPPIQKTQLEAVITQAPPAKNFKTCLHSADKKFATCKTDLNHSIKSRVDSARKIFQKQRNCALKREQRYSFCRYIFLK
jgi:hypothetical protein